MCRHTMTHTVSEFINAAAHAAALLLVHVCIGQELEWRDYVRGKDLARYLRGKQDVLDLYTRPQEQGTAGMDGMWNHLLFVIS